MTLLDRKRGDRFALDAVIGCKSSNKISRCAQFWLDGVKQLIQSNERICRTAEDLGAGFGCEPKKRKIVHEKPDQWSDLEGFRVQWIEGGKALLTPPEARYPAPIVFVDLVKDGQFLRAFRKNMIIDDLIQVLLIQIVDRKVRDNGRIRAICP